MGGFPALIAADSESGFYFYTQSGHCHFVHSVSQTEESPGPIHLPPVLKEASFLNGVLQLTADFFTESGGDFG